MESVSYRADSTKILDQMTLFYRTAKHDCCSDKWSFCNQMHLATLLYGLCTVHRTRNCTQYYKKLYTVLSCLGVFTFCTAVRLSPGGSGYFTCKQNMKLVTTKFKSGGLHEKHVVATWNVGNHLSICF